MFSDQGGQASLIGGYYINDYLSLQLRYGHNSKLHNEATVEGYPPCQSGVDCVAAASWERMLSEVESKSLALRVRADYAISDRWIVSGLAGYSYLFQKIKYSFPEAPVTRISDRVYENGWSYGIGARYQLTPQFAIGAEWMKENLGSIDLESTNLTLEYHFK
ncbi:MAG: porin family protein [Pseudomonadaceae bacterium]|nr:porin family protein [Pseudomonadaceae bacterium]